MLDMTAAEANDGWTPTKNPLSRHETDTKYGDLSDG